ncbi:MAG: 30S ribosomal protein S2 [Candidatus Micrarchaeia archaeon]
MQEDKNAEESAGNGEAKDTKTVKRRHAEAKESRKSDDQESNLEYAEYLEAGVQIGAMIKAPGMSKFIYKTREDGLHLLDLKQIIERIEIAANMLARYNPSDIVVTASRIYAIAPAKKFAEITGTKAVLGRVMPGIFTNPNRPDFMEPAIVLVSDPRNERQAIKEASKINIPIIALADTDNWIKFIDLVVPCNNKGRRSLALVYYLLARSYMKARGLIKSNEEFKYRPSDFEAKIELKSS